MPVRVLELAWGVWRLQTFGLEVAPDLVAAEAEVGVEWLLEVVPALVVVAVHAAFATFWLSRDCDESPL